jgi:hypothetical protein
MTRGKVHREQTPGLGVCGREGNTTTIARRVTCALCRRPKKQDYMKQADDLFSKIVRDRDGVCQAREVSPCKGNLQCAHIISRSYKTIRTDLRNAVALCAGHHTYFTHRPLEWEDWVRESYGTLWDELREAALRGAVPDWKSEVDRLTAVWLDTGHTATTNPQP